MNAAGSQRRPRSPTPADALAAAKVVATCRAVETAFVLAVQRTDDPRVAVAARSAGAFVASIRSRIGDRPATTALRDRLRLEWMASTMLPGRADERLVAECARLLAECLRSLPPRHGFADEIARLRVAHAEAYSLGRAIALESQGDLLFALA